jgi:UDP-glucose 4-epimerase
MRGKEGSAVNVLVTGGAGYIGSHMVRELVRGGHRVVVVDDLSSGHEDAVAPEATFVRADVRDPEVGAVLREHEVEAVFHFASRIQVGESVTHPRLYFRDNLAAAIALLEHVLDARVAHFILSSTAAVYGAPIRTPIDEDHPTVPVNPYGQTKLSIEKMLESYAHAYDFRFAALRYFNAAGAEPGLKERHDPETHLIPLVLDAALGRRESITVFGDDYATPDGTCVRDYIHVADLAQAHLAALVHLKSGGASGAFNLGTGHGHSVREVIETTARVTGLRVPVARGARREGDPPVLVADSRRAKKVFGWEPARSSLDRIVEDAFRARRGLE